MRMAVFGTGYLGATHAACMAELGHDVLGIDVDEAKIARLAAGEVPFFEPGLPELLRRTVDSGLLRFTTDYGEAAEHAELFFIGVGTPQRKGDFAADTTYVEAVVRELAPTLTRNSAIVGKSTVPVGTAARLQELADELTPDGVTLEVLWNPEFLREGFAVKDTLEPDRVVVGLSDPEAGRTFGQDLLYEAYDSILFEGLTAEQRDAGETATPLIVTDLATAELVKVSANAFLATKISFINAVSEVCEAAGADVTVLADAIGMDPRIGRRFLGAGLGFGGGCLPKDIRAFMARAGELGADQAVAFLKEIDSINMHRRVRMVDIARDALGGSFIGKKITILGAAFKPDSDDVRDSPALAVARLIATQGGLVTVTDPQAIGNAQKSFPELDYVADTAEAITGAEAVLLLTEWREYRDLDPAATAELVTGKVLVDGRNVLTPELWRAAGWTYRALGRP